MKLIATDTESILSLLEQDSISRCGQPGISALYRDNDGKLTLILAGHAFCGDGTFGAGLELVVERGVIVGAKAKANGP
jgi:hypothetical protein